MLIRSCVLRWYIVFVHVFLSYCLAAPVVLTPLWSCFRGEAVPLLLGELQLELRPLGRADQTHSQAYGRQAVRLPDLPPGVRPLRPPGAAQEAARAQVEEVGVVRRAWAGLPLARSAQSPLTASSRSEQSWRTEQRPRAAAAPRTRCLGLVVRSVPIFMLRAEVCADVECVASWLARRGIFTLIQLVWLLSL